MNDLARLLVACARLDPDDVASLVDLVPTSRFVTAARAHGLGPAAYVALTTAGLPVPDPLVDRYHRALAHHLRACDALGAVRGVLDEDGIEWVGLKGPIAAEVLHPRPDVRDYADLDIAVQPEQFPAAVAALERAGGVVLEQDWAEVLHLLKGELNIALPSGCIVDLHWDLLYEDATRRAFAWPLTPCLMRRRAVDVHEASVPTFDPDDTVVHLATHACLAGGQRLCWLRDVQLATRSCTPETVLARARHGGVALPVGIVLQRVGRLLGLEPALEHVAAELVAGERWSSLVHAAERTRPLDTWHGVLTGHLVMASTRRTTRTSSGELRRRVAAELRVVRSEPVHPWRRRRATADGAGGSPLLRPRGGAAVRQAYLDAVARCGSGPQQPASVVLVPSSFAPNLGGVEELTRRLGLHLRAAGVEVGVVTNRWPAELPGQDEIDGLRVHRVSFAFPGRHPRRLFRFARDAPPAVRALRTVVREQRAEIVHVQCVSSNALYAFVAARLERVPLVVSLQGELHMDANGAYDRTPLLRRLLRYLLRRADAVTACSAQTLEEAETELAVRTGGRGRVVYNGVDVGELRDAAPERRDRPYVFAIGRLVAEKGFDVLLQAYGISGASPGVELVVAGDGPERPHLEALAAELGLAGHVTFVGRTDRSRTAALFAGAEVFVLPSRHEPLGIVNLEAMAAGRPVLATSVGGVREIVVDGETGRLVPPGDPRRMGDELRSLLTDPAARRRLGEAGRRGACAYDWPRITEQYLEVYAAALAGRRR